MTIDICAQVEQFLRNHQYKLTGVRKAIIRILNASNQPLRVQEIYQQLHDSKTDIASVYRTINLLCELGVVSKLEFQEKLYRYELSDQFVPHHHHLICRRCGLIENIFEQCLPPGFETIIQRHAGFRVESHVIEFYGICQACEDGLA